MIVPDTNVLVRLLVVDDSAQSKAALRLAASEPLLVLRTVLLETEWLLRARFELERARIHAFFEGLMETSSVSFEDEALVRVALDAYASGLDFADAMHLAAARGKPVFSFDKTFVKRGSRLGADVRACGRR